MADLNTCPPAQFLEALKRRHLDGKRELIEDLGTKRTERSVEILAEIMHGESWYLRDLAVNAMANLGDIAAPAVVYLLRSGLWYTRAAAARCLGKMGAAERLPDLVYMLGDPNHTVQGACLASIADYVRAGWARETAKQFWNQGAARARELNKVLTAVHPDAGGTIADLLADPSSFLDASPNAAEESGDVAEKRKNA